MIIYLCYIRMKTEGIKIVFINLPKFKFKKMKKILVVAFVLLSTFANAQAYKGKGDQKFQVGASIQDGATGINATYDYGVGENISIGLSTTYLLGVDKFLGVKPEFQDRADLKLRFNANIGNVLKIDDNLDIYPGLHLGLRNFGGHLGARYFFTDGFGVYTEMTIPFAKYDSSVKGFDYYNNQFVFNIGASFNL